jgi:hypothetical protein
MLFGVTDSIHIGRIGEVIPEPISVQNMYDGSQIHKHKLAMQAWLWRTSIS